MRQVKINGRSIRMRQAIKYLGVYLDSGLKIDKHIHETTQMCQKLFNSLARVT